MSAISECVHKQWNLFVRSRNWYNSDMRSHNFLTPAELTCVGSLPTLPFAPCPCRQGIQYRCVELCINKSRVSIPHTTHHQRWDLNQSTKLLVECLLTIEHVLTPWRIIASAYQGFQECGVRTSQSRGRIPESRNQNSSGIGTVEELHKQKLMHTLCIRVLM